MATATLYGPALAALSSGAIDWATATVECALLDATYVPAQDTHAHASDLTGELTDASYARQTLTGKTNTYDAASNTQHLDAADIVFPALSGTFRYAVILVSTGTASTSPLVAFTDFGSDQVATGVDVTLTVDSQGVVTFDTPAAA